MVCSSTSSSGLGLRRLCPWNKIMGLKLIWQLFASSGSLWVSWTRLNFIRSENFWILDATNSGSWIWKSVCKFRQLARLFVVCEKKGELAVWVCAKKKLYIYINRIFSHHVDLCIYSWNMRYFYICSISDINIEHPNIFFSIQLFLPQ